MNTVVTISLAGRSYTIEESGYAALKAYLDQAAKNLENNPDKDEILKDFETAVAEKCESCLNANKNVVTAAEVLSIIKEMGPVEGAESNEQTKTDETKKEEPQPAKKLYRIREGQVIGGVCNGIAAFFNIDVTIVRLIAILIGIATQGGLILVYIILMIIIPVAETSTEKARAFGTATITAQKLMENAKSGYANFKSSKEWRRWKQQMKEERKRWKYERRANYRPSPFFEVVHSILGLLWFAFFIYIAWFGYNHIQAVHDFFDAIGLAIGHAANIIANKFAQ